jgi:single-strand DNA-binding protein
MRLNQILLVGRLTKNPTLSKHDDESKSRLQFNLAVPRSDKRDAECDYPFCTVWGKYGLSIAEHLRKGREVTITGSLRTSSRQDPESKEWSNFVEVTVAHCSFGLDSKKQREEAAKDSASAPAASIETLAPEVLEQIAAAAAAQVLAKKVQEEGMG